jgi:hypothetical protein
MKFLVLEAALTATLLFVSWYTHFVSLTCRADRDYDSARWWGNISDWAGVGALVGLVVCIVHGLCLLARWAFS